ncbi:Smad nuclear-interacting protein 1 [Oryzias melastigma]|uniref:Smad nuclear-interacting protein 1 n=1 Tax=Oryzias melastigma TaxID=30732 RepID=A0A834EVA7_ORYME|nr:Smad nuclear-interacting protein 1 [Oryzias melastigma]
MTKEKRRRRESPERQPEVKIKQEKLSPTRPHRSRVHRGDELAGHLRGRGTAHLVEGRLLQRDEAADLLETEEAGARIVAERDERAASGDERRRRNEQPEDRRSRWETDRPRDRDRGGERHHERNALESQQAERRQHDARRRENRQRREENQEHDFGQPEEGDNSAGGPPADKEKPNFELSGALTEDTNTFRGVVIKYNEPPEARIPKRRWRLYPFKNDEPLPVMYVHRQSAYLLGHWCSTQRADGTTGRRVRPYIIDLASGNGTYLNNQRIEPQRYYELKEKDVLKFGFSSREYVLLHEFSDTSEVEAQQGEEEEEDEGVDADADPNADADA